MLLLPFSKFVWTCPPKKKKKKKQKQTNKQQQQQQQQQQAAAAATTTTANNNKRKQPPLSSTNVACFTNYWLSFNWLDFFVLSVGHFQSSSTEAQSPFPAPLAPWTISTVLVDRELFHK